VVEKLAHALLVRTGRWLELTALAQLAQQQEQVLLPQVLDKPMSRLACARLVITVMPLLQLLRTNANNALSLAASALLKQLRPHPLKLKIANARKAIMGMHKVAILKQKMDAKHARLIRLPRVLDPQQLVRANAKKTTMGMLE
jgi:hypothetical protein